MSTATTAAIAATTAAAASLAGGKVEPLAEALTNHGSMQEFAKAASEDLRWRYAHSMQVFEIFVHDHEVTRGDAFSA